MMIALSTILVLCFIWLSLSELPAGWDGHKPLPYLIALSALLWIPFLIIAIISGCLREWVVCGCASAGFIASLLRKAQYWLNDIKAPNTAQAIARTLAQRETSQKQVQLDNAQVPTTLDEGHKGQFHVMTLNCRLGRADAQAIVREVKQRDIAVLALQEMSTDLVDMLHDAGLDSTLPYHQFGEPNEHDNGGFNGIWLRVEPEVSTPTGVAIPAADVPSATVRIDNERTITFASAHPKSPMRGCEQWSHGIIGLGEFARHSDRSSIAVVMGDLNSSIDHPSFRKLLGCGFHDATLVEARGEHPTFASWLAWPRLVLDHILFTDYMSAQHVTSFVVSGSDHLALSATLTLSNHAVPVNNAARESWPDTLPKRVPEQEKA